MHWQQNNGLYIHLQCRGTLKRCVIDVFSIYPSWWNQGTIAHVIPYMCDIWLVREMEARVRAKSADAEWWKGTSRCFLLPPLLIIHLRLSFEFMVHSSVTCCLCSVISAMLYVFWVVWNYTACSQEAYTILKRRKKAFQKWTSYA